MGEVGEEEGRGGGGPVITYFGQGSLCIEFICFVCVAAA